MKYAVFVFIALLSAHSYAGDYWPTGINATYHYIADDGTTLDIVLSSFHSRESRNSRYEKNGWYSLLGETVQEDPSGDVFLASRSLYNEGAWDVEYDLSFDPPLKIVDLPMAVGNTWFSICMAQGLYSPCVSSFSCEVVSETTVTVPAGVFDVFEVEIEESTCAVRPFDGPYFLNREVGPVILPGGFKLVSIEGAVGIESRTWGSVKSLFR